MKPSIFLQSLNLAWLFCLFLNFNKQAKQLCGLNVKATRVSSKVFWGEGEMEGKGMPGSGGEVKLSLVPWKVGS